MPASNHMKNQAEATAPHQLGHQHLPVMSYSMENGLLTIRNASEKLNQLHVDTIKNTIHSHLHSRNMLDIVLQLTVIDRGTLQFLFEIFKYCKGISEWNKQVDVAWYISDEELNMTRIAKDFKDIFELDMRIFRIS